MYGEWALKLEFTKPGRDLVISKLVFAKDSVSPAGARAADTITRNMTTKSTTIKRKRTEGGSGTLWGLQQRRDRAVCFTPLDCRRRPRSVTGA
ncbi:MAG: hypothetical protein Ct9H300mP16_04290 [Pseudomonadota bacterium]|nr:MAG: hypothetical protein Ct9H300mP16_04290 [Pseudomonadota bacterium]